MTTTKFSKVLGEVEILNQDTTTTTVKVLKTGEVKKLLNQYANLSDEPFAKVAKKKSAPVRELTEEEKERVAISVERQIREASYVAGLSREQRLEYRHAKSKRIHL